MAEAETGDGPVLYRVEPGTGSAERVVRGSDPAFSPDGEALWFARGDSVFRLPWSGGADGGPEEGAEAALVRGNPRAGALYVLDLETEEVRRLTDELPPRPRPGRAGPDGPGTETPSRGPRGGGGG